MQSLVSDRPEPIYECLRTRLFALLRAVTTGFLEFETKARRSIIIPTQSRHELNDMGFSQSTGINAL